MTRLTPWLVAFATAWVGWLLFGEYFLPARAVAVETVLTVPDHRAMTQSPPSRTATAGAEAFAGDTLFQASGWFEADPYPIRAAALVSGVIEHVHVLEGHAVEAGAPIATLIREDARLGLAAAEADFAAAREAVAFAEAEVAVADARITSMEKQILASEAREAELSDLATRATQLGEGIVSAQDIAQADLRLRTQQARTAALRAELAERVAERNRLRQNVAVLQSRAEQAKALYEARELDWQRTVVTAPVSGIIQRLMAAPGQKKMLASDNPESATVAVIFNPEKVQARIDVPLAEAARLRTGQAVLIQSEFLPGTELRGHVTRIVGEADLQRNTLQVKVQLHEPDPRLRPEMLCRARFLDSSFVADAAPDSAPAEADPGTVPGSALLVYAPSGAIRNDAQNGAYAFAVDASGKRVEKRPLVLGSRDREDFVHVREGLRPGDRVVLEPPLRLQPGDRIKLKQL